VDAETSWRVIEQERVSLADLLEALTDDQWNSPSLCREWRIRDVAAHVAMTPQPPTLGTVAGELMRARGSLNKATRDLAVRYAERPGVDLAAEIREHAASRRLPKVTNYRNIVLDILVHGQDIALPLGIHREMPKDAAIAGIQRAWTMAWRAQAVAARRTSDSTTAAAANSPENTRFMTVCLRGVCSHFSSRTERPV
jgi:uncharacterized protein (TIGR03083 family)